MLRKKKMWKKLISEMANFTKSEFEDAVKKFKII